MEGNIYPVLSKAIMKVGLIIENLDYGVEHLHAIRLSPFYVCHVINLALPLIKRETFVGHLLLNAAV